VIEQHRLKEERALTRDEAAVVTQALRGVITEGTASYYHDLDAEIGRPSAGKTGTTNNFVDAWFIGFIPQLTTSVWVGYPDERRPMVNINGLPEINGENYPLDIWSLYMQDAVQMFPEQQFDVPSPYLDLEVKTDGRTYVKPEKTTKDNDETTENDTDETTENVRPEDSRSRERVAPEPSRPPQPMAPRFASPPPPRTAPPEAQPARSGIGPGRGAPDANPGPRQGRGIP
jgi:penicillin-binding protein 1A